MAPYDHMQTQGRPKPEGTVMSSFQTETFAYRVTEDQQELFGF
jgi:hypothetical protein